MSLVNDSSNMVMPVGPMNSGYSNNGFGWGDGSFWIIILFLFMMGNGWGNGLGFGGGGMMPWMMNNSTNSDVQRGFDQQAVMGGLNGIQSGINSLAQGQCSGFAGVNATVNSVGNGINSTLTNGFFNAETAANARQMANMNQGFTMQTGLSNQLNTIAMNQQNCCCENRAAVADLKYTVATEACADRAAVTSNTQALLNTINGGIQSIKDQLCQDKIDAKNETIANLRQELAMKDLAASQTAQTASLLSDNLRQTQALEQYLNPAPIPAYMVQNPNCCSGNFGYGCGCNGLA